MRARVYPSAPAPGELDQAAVAIVTIDDPSDPRVADYANVRDADLVGRRGLFMAEGEVVVRVLVRRSPMRARSLLLASSRLEAMADVIEALPDETPVYVAGQRVLDALVGFAIHRGVLAAGERASLPPPGEVLARAGEGPGPRLAVALEGLTNHDNVGGVFRNAAAFGAGCVLLDQATCDPLYRKAIRVSAGATLLVPFARAASIEEACSALRAAGYAIWALTPNPPSIDMDGLVASGLAPERLALLLGTEGPGLTDRALSLADERVCIRMEAGFDSLNVATTSGVALFGARHAQRRAPAP